MASEKIILALQKAAITAAGKMHAAMQHPESISVVRKEDNTLQLSLDLISQSSIVESLADIGLPLVLEEDPSTHQTIDSAEEYLVVDPLDGTSSCKRFLAQPSGQVGFGPLIGHVKGGRVVSAVFYNLPTRDLYKAESGCGLQRATITDFQTDEPEFERVETVFPSRLDQCGVLFFVGSNDELKLIFEMKRAGLVENFYRFGGFANDCTRIARGIEQVQLQSMVKAWDFTATLFTHEAGYEVICQPFGERIAYADWRVSSANPILAVPPGLKAELLGFMDRK